GMRELASTGYMHNRVRMVTASFLTKNMRKVPPDLMIEITPIKLPNERVLVTQIFFYRSVNLSRRTSAKSQVSR
ncbi:MAG: hypothetical protein HOI74_09390, partial [Gammaproteobacteria bacterium]|nr:hypothetical protein [Gammaproteobacteria bacterium]